MTDHKISESARCTVDRELSLDGDTVVDEEITNVSAPHDPYYTEYHCECGEDFQDFDEAVEHIEEVK